MEFLDFALIGVCVVIRSNTVSILLDQKRLPYPELCLCEQCQEKTSLMQNLGPVV